MITVRFCVLCNTLIWMHSERAPIERQLQNGPLSLVAHGPSMMLNGAPLWKTWETEENPKTAEQTSAMLLCLVRADCVVLCMLIAVLRGKLIHVRVLKAGLGSFSLSEARESRSRVHCRSVGCCFRDTTAQPALLQHLYLDKWRGRNLSARLIC